MILMDSRIPKRFWDRIRETDTGSSPTAAAKACAFGVDVAGPPSREARRAIDQVNGTCAICGKQMRRKNIRRHTKRFHPGVIA